jgi:hypothetical protein
MKRAALLLVGVAIAVSACGGELASPAGQDATERQAEIYADVVRRLLIGDNTFEPGTVPFAHVFIVDGAIDGAHHPDISVGGGRRQPFTAELRAELVRRLADVAQVKFVESRESVLVNDGGMCGHVRDNGVVITLGPIGDGTDRVEVTNELYVACLAAQWLTYVVERVDGQWQVTGTTGPMAIA